MPDGGPRRRESGPSLPHPGPPSLSPRGRHRSRAFWPGDGRRRGGPPSLEYIHMSATPLMHVGEAAREGGHGGKDDARIEFDDARMSGGSCGESTLRLVRERSAMSRGKKMARHQVMPQPSGLVSPLCG